MCGRYALALRFSQLRQQLGDDMQIDYTPPDDAADAPRQSYNFAPGYHGAVYRADTPDWGAGPRKRTQDEDPEPADEPEGPVSYKLQSMKWGLVPFWTKRNPDYATIMRTINCREDSLSTPGGMWASMKGKKRCIVIAQGFFEWLKVGPKEKMPHYVKRKDGRLMCFAGLWDCVQYEGSEDKLYTYTIITTDSNKQLKFLHDRMPVIFDPGSDKMMRWVDPGKYEWSRELQALLRPFDGELEVYPVSKDVGKNKSNIANFFANAKGKGEAKVKKEDDAKEEKPVEEDKDVKEEPVEKEQGSQKRKVPPTLSPPAKKAATDKKISATRNEYKSPSKAKAGSQKITNFFGTT